MSNFHQFAGDNWLSSWAQEAPEAQAQTSSSGGSGGGQAVNSQTAVYPTQRGTGGVIGVDPALRAMGHAQGVTQNEISELKIPIYTASVTNESVVPAAYRSARASTPGSRPGTAFGHGAIGPAYGVIDPALRALGPVQRAAGNHQHRELRNQVYALVKANK